VISECRVDGAEGALETTVVVRRGTDLLKDALRSDPEDESQPVRADTGEDPCRIYGRAGQQSWITVSIKLTEDPETVVQPLGIAPRLEQSAHPQ
jgi:hypothetical protein